MRKRKYLALVTAAAVVCASAAAIAQASPVSQTLTVTSAKSKQQKKTRGPGDISVTIDTSDVAPFENPKTASQTLLDLDSDFAFDTGTLKTCNPTSLVNTTTDQAKAVCGKSQVGSGNATLCSGTGGCGTVSTPAVVSAFNGVKSGGNPVLLLHTKTGTAAPASILIGTLINSPAGKPYGKRLSVVVPDTAPATLHLTHFFTNIPVFKTGQTKANKKKGTKAKAKYYITAKCSGDKVWQFAESTTFRGGGGTLSATATTPCTQKKAPKKK